MTATATTSDVLHPTREEWLVAAAMRLADRFHEAGHALPEKLRATCGWPSAGGKGQARRVIGECWVPEASADGTSEVFISPLLADPREVLAVLIHELIHASGVRGHRGAFRSAMAALGLSGPAKATVPADDFDARYADDLVRLGAYPHARLTPALSGRKVQGTRMLKATCASCGYTVRLARKWADQGLPSCACGAGEMALEDGPEDEG